MSDLISRKAVINEIQLIEKELMKDKEEARNSDDEQMNSAIDNQLNALWRVRLRVNSLIAAYDVEKVVEQLESAKETHDDECGFDDFEFLDCDLTIDIVRKGGLEE